MERTGGYMSEAMMNEVCGTLKEAGCGNVHIGGGEPFLDFDGLVTLVQTATRHGIGVEYIETNAGWLTNAPDVAIQLQELVKAGAEAYCISMDPFHAEYIPTEKVMAMAAACGAAGLNFFIWQERYQGSMGGVATNRPNSRAEIEKALGKDYIRKTAVEYGIKMGGRAINIEEEFWPCKSIEDVISNAPCKGLLSSNHCHVDMYNRFIPPGCTGIVIPLREIISGLKPGQYPAFEALLSGGTANLYKLATAHGFEPDERGYTSTCGMCFHLRRHLSKREGFPELDKEHYEQSLRYY